MQHENSVNLKGNIGNDITLNKTTNNTSVVNIRIATTSKFINKNKQEEEITYWNTIVAWGKLAEKVVSTMKKGDLIRVLGQLVSKKDKNKDISISEVKASEIHLIYGK